MLYPSWNPGTLKIPDKIFDIQHNEINSCSRRLQYCFLKRAASHHLLNLHLHCFAEKQFSLDLNNLTLYVQNTHSLPKAQENVFYILSSINCMTI